MGARRLTVQDPTAIVEDMPEKKVVGRDRRKAEYQAERAAKKPAPKQLNPVTHPYPGHVAPESMFPEWDFVNEPWGPPLDDPLVAAYCDMQWKAFNKWAKKQREQGA